jgi:hypothetical protein
MVGNVVKLQFLGDARDSFKWDYHRYLVTKLGYARLGIVWMLTPDNTLSHGQSAPEAFPADPLIHELCYQLRLSRDRELIRILPGAEAAFKVQTYDQIENFLQARRLVENVSEGLQDEVIFLDPDNGFEPEKSASASHVRYREVQDIVAGATESTVVTVFQFFRRKDFVDDFKDIRKRLGSFHSAAAYQRGVMMIIAISKSKEICDRVSVINREYAKMREGVTSIS